MYHCVFVRKMFTQARIWWKMLKLPFTYWEESLKIEDVGPNHVQREVPLPPTLPHPQWCKMMLDERLGIELRERWSKKKRRWLRREMRGTKAVSTPLFPCPPPTLELRRNASWESLSHLGIAGRVEKWPLEKGPLYSPLLQVLLGSDILVGGMSL